MSDCQRLLRIVRVEKTSGWARIAIAATDSKQQTHQLVFSVNTEQDIEGVVNAIASGAVDTIFIHPMFIERGLPVGVDFTREYPTLVYCRDLVEVLLSLITAPQSP